MRRAKIAWILGLFLLSPAWAVPPPAVASAGLPARHRLQLLGRQLPPRGGMAGPPHPLSRARHHLDPGAHLRPPARRRPARDRARPGALAHGLHHRGAQAGVSHSAQARCVESAVLRRLQPLARLDSHGRRGHLAGVVRPVRGLHPGRSEARGGRGGGALLDWAGVCRGHPRPRREVARPHRQDPHGVLGAADLCGRLQS
jgi:hypothetical protein